MVLLTISYWLHSETEREVIGEKKGERVVCKIPEVSKGGVSPDSIKSHDSLKPGVKTPDFS